ncbi:ROK family protein [Trueperella pyogenes]|uniref:ROK family protein n=1 Tax=Trueperella pyogenes TaxID=1661 RepID=UPI00345C9853
MKKKYRKVAIGVDVGGSGIKGAPVDLKTGQFIDKRLRIPTPGDAAPAQIAEIIGEIVNSFGLPEEIPVGVSFPAPIVRGQIPFIANLSQEWAGIFPARFIAENIQRPVAVMNDADAAVIRRSVLRRRARPSGHSPDVDSRHRHRFGARLEGHARTEYGVRSSPPAQRHGGRALRILGGIRA